MKSFGFDLLREQILSTCSTRIEKFDHDPRAESEIERLLLQAIQWQVRIGGGPFSRATVWANLAIPIPEVDPRLPEFFICPQMQVAGWRVDFFIIAYDFNRQDWMRLIVECDGHDFHERTKEQAARDRSRDRRANLDGFTILRFTGSEIWRNPMGCGQQIEQWAAKGLRR